MQEVRAAVWSCHAMLGRQNLLSQLQILPQPRALSHLLPAVTTYRITSIFKISELGGGVDHTNVVSNNATALPAIGRALRKLLA